MSFNGFSIFARLCKNQHEFQNIIQKRNTIPISFHSPFKPEPNHKSYLSPLISLFCIFNLNGTLFVPGFFLFSIIFSSFIHIAPRITYPFHNWKTVHCLDIPDLTYPFITWWIFDLFPFFCTMNNAAVKILHAGFCVNTLLILLCMYLELRMRVVAVW